EVGIGKNHPDILYNMGPSGRPGASLRGWRNYFSNASIFGADIDKRILFSESRISTFYVDQSQQETIHHLFENFEHIRFDILIDDGLHTYEANATLLTNSFNKMANRGLYIIEDIEMAQQNLRIYDVLFSDRGIDGFMIQIPHSSNSYDNCMAWFG